MNTTHSLIKIIGKDFEIATDLSEEQLREVMTNAFAYLVENDFPKLIRILYRADVDQEKLKIQLETTTESSTATVIANAYINRQMAKIATWEKYSSR